MAYILVIDDNDDIRALVKTILSREGHVVAGAADGEAGWLSIKRDRPDAVVLDLNLPKIDGHELCQRLKSDPTTKQIPVVMLTAAYTDVEDAQRGLAIGADEYIIKPFMHAPFIHAINRLVHKTGPTV